MARMLMLFGRNGTPSVATAGSRCKKGYGHPLMRDQDALRENFGGPEYSTVA